MEQIEWMKSDLQSFWRNIARHDRLIQLYENEKVFLDTLEGYVGCALLSNENVIVFATEHHLESLRARLIVQNFNIDELTLNRKYVPVEANLALSEFMSADLPDESLFNEYISQIVSRSAENGGHVRIFGEMVAELWQRGSYEATARLQQLWANIQSLKNFSLFCAFPQHCVQSLPKENLKKLCLLPTTIIDGRAKPSTEILYGSLN